jgi:hypothetical protein
MFCFKGIETFLIDINRKNLGALGDELSHGSPADACRRGGDQCRFLL